MNNILVFCEVTEEQHIAEVSLELCSKARKLADRLNSRLDAIVIGNEIENIEGQLYPYGVDSIFYLSDSRLSFYQTLPFFSTLTKIIKEETPDIVLFGATSVGRDLAPRIASYLRCGLTADCTSLEIGDHTDAKTKTVYKDILYQIRPAFGGNIIATIVSPETRPQMATVREGVMKKEIYNENHKGEVHNLKAEDYVNEGDFCIEIIERQIEAQKINIKGAPIIVAGGYGMGSKENFALLHELANAIGGEVGATRAAVDAGFTENERQIGQTGITVRPKLYIACGISGAVQHRAGMDQSSKIISINTDPNAPINAIADYTIIGDVMDVLPKMIKSIKN
ncbi:MAG: electron transfer flavoprotein subunit alpha/FixB family protein [Bacteroidales bacterium]|nr:electron transfer flavoprotein subunit alpha/FixB family protein [Bacteroidales bacterium]MBO5848808.1 electron transfer flavoprotein subunit alpha/FixB family protein [Bacteroidales bacterium]